MKIEIDFLKYKHQLIAKKEKKKPYIFDLIRQKFLVKTPEEMVRQLVILYLMAEKGYPQNRFSVEKGLKVNRRSKRFDILVYGEAMQNFLLVECKAPAVEVNQETLWQASVYNLPLKVRYLMVTNGRTTYCCKMDYTGDSPHFLNEVPAYPSQSSQ